MFATVLARALDEWWHDLGRPDPFVVVEAGAGTGTLARDVLAAGPLCASALRYVLVERSERLRARQAERLALEVPAALLGPSADEEAGGPEGDRNVGGTGPAVASLADLPAPPVTGVVLANELLDNLPFLLLERRSSSPPAGPGWDEVRVGVEAGRLSEVLVPAAAHLAAEADRLAPDAPGGGRLPLQHDAGAWLRRALALVERGRVVVVDYADTSPSMARRPWLEWVRTYRGHARGGHPLEGPGAQDVTCEVAVDQLARVRPADCDRAQAEFLADHGIDQLVASARQAWAGGAAVGGLAAVKARSRVTEAAALVDPAGLGAFRVLEWSIG